MRFGLAMCGMAVGVRNGDARSVPFRLGKAVKAMQGRYGERDFGQASHRSQGVVWLCQSSHRWLCCGMAGQALLVQASPVPFRHLKAWQSWFGKFR